LSEILLSSGWTQSGTSRQNGQKSTLLTTSLTTKRSPKPNIFFSLLIRRLAKSFEGLNSSLAQLAEELSGW